MGRKTLLLLCGVLLATVNCGGPLRIKETLNYLAARCEDAPQIDIFSWPQRATCPSQAKAIFYFRAQNLSRAWGRRLGTIVYRAFKQEGVFQELHFGGPSPWPRLETLFRRGYAFLVVVEKAALMAPTKTTPGHLLFDLRVLSTKDGAELWSFTGSWDLCPDYPKNYANVSLTRGRLPAGDPYAVERALFQMAREMAGLIRAYGCYPAQTIPEAPWQRARDLKDR